MRSPTIGSLTFCAIALAAAPGQAALIQLDAMLDGAQEVPQVGLPGSTQADLGGSGSATMTFDDVTHVLTWTILYNLNTGPATAAHFHGATNPGDLSGPGIASPVRVTILGIAGTSSGTVMGSFDLDALVNSADNSANLLGGLWYVNIHTLTFPSGEIRGQVLRAPEPGAFSLLAVGLAALGIRWTRRKRRLAG